MRYKSGGTRILNEDTQPVIRAIGVSQTACKKMIFDKIFDLTPGVSLHFIIAEASSTRRLSIYVAGIQQQTSENVCDLLSSTAAVELLQHRTSRRRTGQAATTGSSQTGKTDRASTACCRLCLHITAVFVTSVCSPLSFQLHCLPVFGLEILQLP